MKTEFIKSYMAPSSELIEVVSEQPLMTMSYEGNGTIDDANLENWGVI